MKPAIVLVLALCALLQGCSGNDAAPVGAASQTGPSGSGPAAKAGPERHAGQQTFEFWCAPCHAAGAEHPGTRRLAERLSPELSVLLERPGLEAAYVQAVVRNGFQMMPPFRATEISDEQLNALAVFVADASRNAGHAGNAP